MAITIHYDVSRLVSRAYVPTPAGQERVDIQYANYIATNPKLFELNGLFQYKGNILLVSNILTKKLIDQLFNKWILNSCPDDIHKIKIDQLLEMLRLEVLNVRLLKSANIDMRLNAPREDRKKTVYVNVAFDGNNYDEIFTEYKKISGVKMLCFINDLLPIEFPEYFRRGVAQSHLQRVIGMSKCADTIIPISYDVGDKLSSLLTSKLFITEININFLFSGECCILLSFHFDRTLYNPLINVKIFILKS
jgi:hypothetical protein